MKILYLTQILSPSVGGGELLFFNLAKGMLRLGHQVHVICHEKKEFQNVDTEAPNSRLKEIELMGGIIHYVKPAEENNGTTPFGRNIFSIIKTHLGYTINTLRTANTLYKHGEIDIIHANMYIPVIAGYFFSKIRQIPLVITLHNPSFDRWKQWSSQEGIPSTLSFLGPLTEKIILKLPVNVVHVVSRKVRDELKIINSSAKSVLIYNGVEIEGDVDLPINLRYEKYVLYIGRLVAGKNLQTVILAFKKVAQQMPDAKLIIVGDGPLRQEWEDLVILNNLQDNVFFLGSIFDKERKYDLLAKSSAVVFPSISEGFALLPIEAFQMSKPILISNLKPSDEIVDDGVDGYLLPPYKLDDWTKKILFLLNNPEICKDMGSKGRLKVVGKFNMNAVSYNMERLYKSLISKGL